MPRPEKYKRKYIKEFLGDVVLKLHINEKYKIVFISRFDPENVDFKSSTLAGRHFTKASDASQTYQDGLKKCYEAFERLGCLPVPKKREGTPSLGDGKWHEPYQWLWTGYYPLWEKEYEDKCVERTLASSLSFLNFKKQIDKITEVVVPNPISAFCIDVDSPSNSVEKWTLSTLTKAIPNVTEKSLVTFKRTPDYPDSNEWFWDEIKRCLEMDAEKEDLLSHLLNKCKDGSVLIVLTSVNNLPPDLENELLNDFFLKLTTFQSSGLPEGHCFVVIMIREIGNQPFPRAIFADNLDTNETIEVNTYPIILESVNSISGHEVNKWLLFQKQRLMPLMGDRYSRFIHEVKGWDETTAMDKSPLRILNKICQIAGLEKGVAEIENYWRFESIS